MTKKFLSLILLISLISLLAGCSFAQKETYKIKNPSLEAGFAQKLSGSFENLSYDIKFPCFNNQAIDEFLSKQITQKVRDFVSSSSNGKKELYGEYQTFLYGDGNISIQMQYLLKDTAAKTQNETAQTFVFNENKPVSASSVFKRNKIDAAIEAIKNAILSNSEYKADFLKKSDSLQNSMDSLENFVFSNDSVIFFYDKNTILPEKYGVVSVKVSKDSLQECFAGSSPKPFSGKTSGAKEAIEQGRPIIALTFDDGPMEGTTNLILDELEKHDAHATFFVCGNQAKHYPALLKRQIDLGCEIGNHTYSHPALTSLNSEKMKEQISKTNEIVSQANGVTPSLVRPPYGSINQAVKNNLKARFILWDLDTLDWKTRNTEATIKAVLDGASDGQIVLMHDIHDPTAKAAKKIIPELINRGFYLATVSEMFEAKGYFLEEGKAYNHAN